MGDLEKGGLQRTVSDSQKEAGRQVYTANVQRRKNQGTEAFRITNDCKRGNREVTRKKGVRIYDCAFPPKDSARKFILELLSIKTAE